MAENAIYLNVGAPVGVPDPGKKAIFADTDGSIKALDSTGAKSSVGAGGYGSDAIVDLPNSNAALVEASELVTSLTTQTAGSEVSRFLLKLLSAGAKMTVVQFDPASWTVDFGALTTWDLVFRRSGTLVGVKLETNSNGQMIVDATGAAVGSFIVKDKNGFTALNVDATFGVQVGGGLQQRQFANVASANNLTIPSTTSNGGNCGHITGSTQINLIDITGKQNGSELWLMLDSGLTLKHNQAPSGNFLPMFLAGSADIVAAAGARVGFRLMGNNNGTAAVGWYQMAPILTP
jgi:hypothetical protein